MGRSRAEEVPWLLGSVLNLLVGATVFVIAIEQ